MNDQWPGDFRRTEVQLLRNRFGIRIALHLVLVAATLNATAEAVEFELKLTYDKPASNIGGLI